MTHPAFFPFQDLANTLLPHTGDTGGDTSHLQRVWKNAAAIQLPAALSRRIRGRNLSVSMGNRKRDQVSC
jgi:hypothetical protein